MTTRRTIRLALVAGLVIAAAACGDDDDADSGGDGTSAPAATDAVGTTAAVRAGSDGTGSDGRTTRRHRTG